MKAKDIQNWQDNIALDRFNIIQHLLNPDLDKPSSIALRAPNGCGNSLSVKGNTAHLQECRKQNSIDLG